VLPFLLPSERPSFFLQGRTLLVPFSSSHPFLYLRPGTSKLSFFFPPPFPGFFLPIWFFFRGRRAAVLVYISTFLLFFVRNEVSSTAVPSLFFSFFRLWNFFGEIKQVDSSVLRRGWMRRQVPAFTFLSDFFSRYLSFFFPSRSTRRRSPFPPPYSPPPPPPPLPLSSFFPWAANKFFLLSFFLFPLFGATAKEKVAPIFPFRLSLQQ